MVIQLARAPKKDRDRSGAALRHLWGIVIVGGPDDPRPSSHYSAGSVRRLRPESSLAARERALVRTLERATSLIPAERLITVLERTDVARHAADLAEFGEVRVVVQPAWRGNAAQVFLPALRILRVKPHPTNVVLPHEQMHYHATPIVHHPAHAAGAVQIPSHVPL